MGFFSDILFGTSDDEKKKTSQENSLPFGVSEFDVTDYRNGSDDEFDDNFDDEFDD